MMGLSEQEPAAGPSYIFGGSSSSSSYYKDTTSDLVGEPEAVAPTAISPELKTETEAEDYRFVRNDIVRRKNIPCCCCSICIARRPCTCAMIGIAVVATILGVGLTTLPFEIETNFDSFLITDVEDSMRLAAFNEAVSSRSLGTTRRLQATASSGSTIYNSKDLHIVYELVGAGGPTGILSTKVLNQIAAFEQRFRDLDGYAALCNQTSEKYRGLCDPGLSFAQYGLPTLEIAEGETVVPSAMKLDGRGWDSVPLKAASLVAESHGVRNLFIPEEWDAREDMDPPVALQSMFRFRFAIGSAADPITERSKRTRKITEVWHKFFLNVVLDGLGEQMSRESFGDDIKVWFDGTGFKDFEVRKAVLQDIPLAIGSGIFVLIYMFCHTRSVILAFMGPTLAVLSVPLTFVLCGVFFGTTTVSFANFLAIFLSVGFGADVMFVYTDIWEDSVVHAESVSDRLAWTYRRAVKASLATTSTTALSFLCNMASVIRALRQFGFFMGFCVLNTWLLISFIYVPILILEHTTFLAKIRIQQRPREKNDVTLKDMFFEAFAERIYVFRYVIMVILLLFFGTCVGLSVISFQYDEGVVTIFPEHHNQNRGVGLLTQFSEDGIGSTFQEPPRSVKVCDPLDYKVSTENCAMLWCEALSVEPQQKWQGNGTCQCKRKLNDCHESQDWAHVMLRMVGPSALPASALLETVGSHLLSGPGSEQVTMEQEQLSNLMTSQTRLPELFQQEWESGDTSLTSAIAVEAYMQRLYPNASCGWEEICFCGSYLQCKTDENWTEVDSMEFGRRLQQLEELPDERELYDEACGLSGCPAALAEPTGQAERRLVELVDTSLPLSKRMKVRVTFGLTANSKMQILGETLKEDMWGFNSDFDLSDPWAQRALYYFCADMPPDLKIHRIWCWFEDFHEFARNFYGRFPVKATDWKATSRLFIDTSSYATRGTRYIWYENDDVRGMYYSLDVAVNKGGSSAKIMEHKKKFDDYIKDWNDRSPKSAGDAFQVSQTFVRVESAAALIGGTLTSLAILCVLSFIAMLIFTHSMALSGVVVFSTMTVIVILAFFTTAVFEWKLGLIEVVAFIYFIGYALDYSLHIVYKYSSDEALLLEKPPSYVPADKPQRRQRVQRTAFALKAMGSATLGSSITTAGSALFLIFCTLTLFFKLGAMCFTLTTASIIFSLIPLSAGLMLFGPLKPGKCRVCGCPNGLPRMPDAPGSSFQWPEPPETSGATSGSSGRSLAKIKGSMSGLGSMVVIPGRRSRRNDAE